MTHCQPHTTQGDPNPEIPLPEAVRNRHHGLHRRPSRVRSTKRSACCRLSGLPPRPRTQRFEGLPPGSCPDCAVRRLATDAVHCRSSRRQRGHRQGRQPWPRRLRDRAARGHRRRRNRRTSHAAGLRPAGGHTGSGRPMSASPAGSTTAVSSTMRPPATAKTGRESRVVRSAGVLTEEPQPRPLRMRRECGAGGQGGLADVEQGGAGMLSLRQYRPFGLATCAQGRAAE